MELRCTDPGNRASAFPDSDPRLYPPARSPEKGWFGATSARGVPLEFVDASRPRGPGRTVTVVPQNHCSAPRTPPEDTGQGRLPVSRNPQIRGCRRYHSTSDALSRRKPSRLSRPNSDPAPVHHRRQSAGDHLTLLGLLVVDMERRSLPPRRKRSLEFQPDLPMACHASKFKSFACMPVMKNAALCGLCHCTPVYHPGLCRYLMSRMGNATNDCLCDPLVIPPDYYTHSYFHWLRWHILPFLFHTTIPPVRSCMRSRLSSAMPVHVRDGQRIAFRHPA